jgi:quercetin dioxygenase-like cupin family protein
MSKPYNKAHFDFDNLPWLTSPRKQLELEAVALGLISLPPGEGYTFTHTHREQEEVYTVVSGSGILYADGEIIEIIRGDIFRVAAHVRRALKAHEAGLFVICSGAVPMGFPKNPNSRYMIDDGIPHYDDIPPWYEGLAEVALKNQHLKERMIKARMKRENQEKS